MSSMTSTIGLTTQASRHALVIVPPDIRCVLRQKYNNVSYVGDPIWAVYEFAYGKVSTVTDGYEPSYWVSLRYMQHRENRHSLSELIEDPAYYETLDELVLTLAIKHLDVELYVLDVEAMKTVYPQLMYEDRDFKEQFQKITIDELRRIAE